MVSLRLKITNSSGNCTKTWQTWKKPGTGALQVHDKVVHIDKEKAEPLDEFFVNSGKDLEKNFSSKGTESILSISILGR